MLRIVMRQTVLGKGRILIRFYWSSRFLFYNTSKERIPVADDKDVDHLQN